MPRTNALVPSMGSNTKYGGSVLDASVLTIAGSVARSHGERVEGFVVDADALRQGVHRGGAVAAVALHRGGDGGGRGVVHDADGVVLLADDDGVVSERFAQRLGDESLAREIRDGDRGVVVLCMRPDVRPDVEEEVARARDGVDGSRERRVGDEGCRRRRG